jgi:hypothetical protein
LTDHPTPEEIAGLARGKLSRERRKVLVTHLLRGCTRCCGALAPALALAPELLARSARRAVRRAVAEQARCLTAQAAAAAAVTARPALPSPRQGRQVAPGARPAPAAPRGVDAAAEPAMSEMPAITAMPAVPEITAGARPAPKARRRSLGHGQGSAAAAADSYERPVARACAAAVRRFREIEAERHGGAAEEPGRREAVAGQVWLQVAGEMGALDGATRASSMRGPRKVEMLLAASWELRFSDPHEMVRLAELALFAAERLDNGRYGRSLVADLRACCWAELANAHRVADDLARAEQAMARAVCWQRRGSGDPWLVARIADRMSTLFADQRRFAEAAELLDRVHGFYRQVGDSHLAGQALIKHGIFTGYNNDSRRALVLLTEGLELIDTERDWRLAVQAVQAILWNLVECGRCRQARIHLWRSRALLERHGGKLHLLRLRWLSGRIHAGIGELERAERDLVATKEGFAAAGSPYNAALVSLDLAAIWLQQGKTPRVRLLVDEMIAVFRSLRIAREAVAALLILREACDHDEATLDRVRAVAILLTELERQPQRRLAAGADAALISPRPSTADPER